MSKKKVVVIGAGLAGSLVSNQLAGSSDVTTLEIGPEKGIRYPNVKFVNKRLAEVDTFCFGGGGTTNLWHNGLIPIQLDDVSSPGFRNVLSDAGRFMDPAAAALFFKPGSYSSEYMTARTQMNQLGGDLGFGKEGLDCLIYPKSFTPLRICSPANARYEVDDVEFERKGDRITAVRFAQGGLYHTLEADAVIVSAGTIGNPKIIQRLVHTAGEGVVGLGSGFIDHPMGFVGKVRFKPGDARKIRQISSSDRGEYTAQGILRIKSQCGGFRCGVFFRPALTMENRLDLYKFKSSLGAARGAKRLKNALSLKVFHPDIVAEIFAHLSGSRIPSRTYGILLVAEQKRGGNRVSFERDELVVDWSITEDELRGYRNVLAQLGGLLGDVAEEVVLRKDLTDSWLWSCAHHSGSMPMGNGNDDLIDQHLKLKFFENVFVCDGSVIQEHSYANTGLTIGQLAFRVAERIHV